MAKNNGSLTSHARKTSSEELQDVIHDECHRGIVLKGRREANGGFFFPHELRQIGLHVESADCPLFTLSGKLPAFRKFEEMLRDETTPMKALEAEVSKIIKRYPNNVANIILMIGRRLIAEQWNLPGKFKRSPKPARLQPTTKTEVLEAIANSYLDGFDPEELEQLVRLAMGQFSCSSKEVEQALRVGTREIN